MDPAPKSYNQFMDDVTRPIMRNLFTFLVQQAGPKTAGVGAPVFHVSDEQEDALAELEELTQLYQ
eukprot:8902149-Lingulodinium_polyedra.AAC.1